MQMMDIIKLLMSTPKVQTKLAKMLAKLNTKMFFKVMLKIAIKCEDANDL